MKQIKKLINLPPEVRAKFLTLNDVDERNQYIRNLRDVGWTLTSIAEVCGMTRERAPVTTIQSLSAAVKSGGGTVERGIELTKITKPYGKG